MIKGFLKNKYRYLYINEIFLVTKKGRCLKKNVRLKAYFFLEELELEPEPESESVKKLPGAGAGQKRTISATLVSVMGGLKYSGHMF